MHAGWLPFLASVAIPTQVGGIADIAVSTARSDELEAARETLGSSAAYFDSDAAEESSVVCTTRYAYSQPGG